ncbi:hypothetical protein [Nannocystis radixulma]|uniref:Uncharacterized protein n=1 Tax=Nannocystis radixulma TaxID=2995305 RepID=A0ABT5BDV1_9BACT|nr:hypothetical protein [Nannocystis radixulma]MDC0672311.1 hypothetical protein [Nannocystis radixulma]
MAAFSITAAVGVAAAETPCGFRVCELHIHSEGWYIADITVSECVVYGGDQEVCAVSNYTMYRGDRITLNTPADYIELKISAVAGGERTETVYDNCPDGVAAVYIGGFTWRIDFEYEAC